jgi:hypothetical protein
MHLKTLSFRGDRRATWESNHISTIRARWTFTYFLTKILRVTSFSLPSPLAAWIVFSSVILLNVSSAHALTLELPLRCSLGKDCFIQNYPDHDTSPKFKDYRCGDVLGYNGHDGTDFRLPDYAAMRAGVEVIASADGVVRGVRDGMDDISVKTIGKAAIKDKECGNGVAIVHQGGWETQYCHIKKGSLRVHKNQQVKAGDVLGQVGLSGDTEFPHVHLSVRDPNKRKIDPFTGSGLNIACAPNATTTPSTTLWSNVAQSQLTYTPTGVLNSGFSDHATSYEAAQNGEEKYTTLPTTSPALVYWVQWFGLHDGDVITMHLTAPDNTVLATDSAKINGNKAVIFRLLGSKQYAGNWPAGTYTGSYTIARKDVPSLQGKADLTVK